MDINYPVAVAMLRSPLNLHLQQNIKVALNTKRAQRKKIRNVRNVEGMKVVQMNTLDVTSVPGGTINSAQHLKMEESYFECHKYLDCQ